MKTNSNNIAELSVLFFAVIALYPFCIFSDTDSKAILELQNTVLQESGAMGYDQSMAEEFISYKGISYEDAGIKVAKLGKNVIPLLYKFLTDIAYLQNYKSPDPDIPSYITFGSIGQERDYRYCVWLVATRELAEHIKEDIRKRFLEHLISVAQTPRTWTYGEMHADYIAYESIATLASFKCIESDNALDFIMQDERRKINIRILGANYLLKSSIPEIQNRARIFILDAYEKKDLIADLYSGYPNLLAFWNLGAPRIRKEIADNLNQRMSPGVLPLVFFIYESDPMLAKDILVAYLNRDFSNESLIPSYYPLVILEFLLEHYPIEELGLVWIKERCLAHGLTHFLGYARDYDKDIALRWLKLRKKYFPELEEVELQLVNDENRDVIWKQWKPYIARDPWRIVYTIDKETGEVVLGAGKE